MKLQNVEVKDFKKIISQSYKKDFPRYERKPIFQIKNIIKNKKAEAVTLMNDKNNMISYSIIITKSKYNYILIDYLATVKEYRGLGYGSKFINLLKEKYSSKNGIIIEIEKIGYGKTEEENILRQKRLEFYLKLGFKPMNYNLKLFGTHMQVLVLDILNKEDLNDNFHEILFDIYNSIYGKVVLKKYIKIYK